MGNLFSNTHQARVVIIDDHAAVVEMMTTAIEALTVHKVVGFAVEAVSAIEVCRQKRPDVVLLDLVMPGASGVKVLAELRRVCPRARVLIFSGNLTAEAVRGAVAAGVHGIVEKMSSLSELRTALDAVAAGRIYFSPLVSRQITELVRRRRARRPQRPVALSKRETVVLRYLARGLSSKEIATELGISANTVVSHRSNLMHKIGLRRAAQLSLYAAQTGVIDEPTYAAGV